MEQNNISQEILDGFRDGELRCFDKVFLTYNSKVKFFVNKIVRSKEDAEEITQDVFVKLWENRESIGNISRFSSYIFVTAKNSAIDFLRRNNTNRQFLEKLMITQEESYSVEDEINGAYVSLLINMIATTLPKRQRKIFLLSYEKKMTNEEIAVELNISKKSVENSLSLTRAIFKNSFVILIALYPVIKIVLNILR